MSVAPKRRLTPQEYLAIERQAEFRSEFYNGEMFAMAGASMEHNRVKQNLIIELGNRLRGTGCESFSSDMRVNVPSTGLYTYPDIVIVCGTPELEDQHGDTLLNPQVIIEVLSPSTANYDRGKKLRHYKQVASLQEYVLVAQDEPAIDRYVRKPNGEWTQDSVEGIEQEFAFATVSAKIPLKDIYAGVSFPPEVP
ncbi:MAG: Uma2 family endonuclease [Gemmataceae bacterium]